MMRSAGVYGLILAAVATAGCKSDPCGGQAPAFELDVSAPPAVAGRAQSLRVTLATDPLGHLEKTFDVGRTLADGTTSLAVAVVPAPTSSFPVTLDVEAFAGTGGMGDLLASGTMAAQAAPNACNHFSVELVPPGSPGADGGAGDGGSPTNPSDAGSPVNPGDAGTPVTSGADAGVTAFPYAPFHLAPQLEPVVGPAVDLACPHAALDTENPSGDSWCSGPAPSRHVVTSGMQGQVLVVTMRELSIAAGTTLQITGSLPVIIAVYGDARIDGAIRASARGSIPGPGSPGTACGPSAGGNADPASSSGGGGGGAAVDGANGGTVMAQGPTIMFPPGGRQLADIARVATTGDPVGAPPLRGGCPGGIGGGGSSGGGGGGAFQLSAAGTVAISGTISVSGGGGVGGVAQVDGNPAGGGGGGGAAGSLWLEASTLQLQTSATLKAVGGAGGGGGTDASTGIAGQDGDFGGAGAFDGNGNGTPGPGGTGGAATSSISRPLPGGNGDSRGNSGKAGGGGGGGAYGALLLRGVASCTIASKSGLSGLTTYIGMCH